MLEHCKWAIPCQTICKMAHLHNKLNKKSLIKKNHSYNIGKRVSTLEGCKLEIERKKKRHSLKYTEKIKESLYLKIYLKFYEYSWKHPKEDLQETLKGSFIVKLKAIKDLTFSMCNFRIVWQLLSKLCSTNYLIYYLQS